MKKLFLIIVCICSSIYSFGQIYEREKPLFVSEQHRIHLYGIYEKNNNGLYQYIEYEHDKPVSSYEYRKLSIGNEHFYGYDKKNNRYYFYTDNVIGYYNPTKIIDTKDFRKRINNKNVPIVSLEDIPQMRITPKTILDKVYKDKNDSIIEDKRIALEKQREQQIKDSIEAMKKKAVEHNEYRKNHTWHDLTMDIPVSVYCNFCTENHIEREFYIISLNSDTIYFLLNRPSIVMLGKVYSQVHYGKITEQIKQNRTFKDYVEIWRDSLALHNELTNSDATKANLYRYIQYKTEIKKEAPYGFVESWGWELNSADGVEPYFTYYNTSDKTIKYVDFYFNLYNAVGDKCYLKYDRSYTGHVRGVGPVEADSSGSWNWERATHYTTADASEMRIVKIVITYMDKTVRNLTGNAIKYN
ncbi:MAG: hypothetical protein IJ742_00105 [Prevotella sp.]|nr:hypothetical protein [Prevotella sp.]